MYGIVENQGLRLLKILRSDNVSATRLVCKRAGQFDLSLLPQMIQKSLMLLNDGWLKFWIADRHD